MVRGSRPNSLVRMTRTEWPPREMWTISRKVVSSRAPNLPSGLGSGDGRGGPGADPVVGRCGGGGWGGGER